MANEKTNPQTSADMYAAVDKLRDEMAMNAKDGAIQIVGQIMTELLRILPDAQAQINKKDKTIKGAMETMKQEASKNKSGNWAALDGLSGMKIVAKYYGIEDDAAMQRAVANSFAAYAQAPEPERAPRGRSAELDLDALLEDI